MCRFLDYPAHLRHGIHIDACLCGAHIYTGADKVCLGQSLRNGTQQQLISLGKTLLHQSGKAADKIDAAFLCRAIHCQGKRYIIRGAAAAGHKCHGGNGDSLVYDGDAKLAFYCFTCFDKVFRFTGDFIINFIAAALGVFADAVQQ